MIITFYSFKGGVGRTMALANVAVLLAEAGHSVLAVDFDLEAPGITSYLSGAFGEPLNERQGLIDLLSAYPDVETTRVSDDASAKVLEGRPLPELDMLATWDPPKERPSPEEEAAVARGQYVDSADAVDWREFVTSLGDGRHAEGRPLASSMAGRLDVITSGRGGEDYAAAVLAFEWKEFFEQKAGGAVIEGLRQAWSDEYDFVLIDSRTGLTDTGGLCTIHLPDVLIPVFTANEQSLMGALHVTERALEARRHLARAPGPFVVFPLLSRFDDRTEVDLASEWLGRIAETWQPYVASWLPAEHTTRHALNRTKLPYVPRYSFGETLPIDHPDARSDRGSLGYSLRTVASILGSNFDTIPAILGEQQTDARAPKSLDERLAAAVGDLADGRDRAIAVLLRAIHAEQADPQDPRGELVPIDLLGDEQVIDRLVNVGLLGVDGRAVYLAEHGFTVSVGDIGTSLAKAEPLLDWSARVRRSAANSLTYALGGDLLAQGLRWNGDAPQFLTMFERQLIRESLAGSALPPVAWRRSYLLPAAMAACLLAIGAAAGVVATVGSKTATPALSALIGMTAVLPGALVLFATWVLADRRLRRRDAGTVIGKEPWSTRRDLARALETLGYAPTVMGDQILFELTNPRLLTPDPIVRQIIGDLSPGDLRLVARPTTMGSSAADATAYLLEGSEFVMRRLERRLRRHRRLCFEPRPPPDRRAYRLVPVDDLDQQD